MRDLVAENKLSSDDLIQPLFIADQKESQIDIPSMPGIYRHNLDSLYAETEELLRLGVKAIAIFPAIHPDKKILKLPMLLIKLILFAMPCKALSKDFQKLFL